MPPTRNEDKAPSAVMDRDGLLALVRSWMEDESGYDERVWPIIKKAIEENRLSSTDRFDEQTPHS